MATFQQRDGGRWQAKVRRRGCPVQSQTFAKKADAEAWARKVESELERGVWRDTAEAERTTLGEALERYEREVTPRKKGAEQEVYRVRALRRLPLARQTLARIRGADIAAYRDAELDRLAPSSVVKQLALLSHLYETARKEWGIEVDNPVRKISKPKFDNSRARRLEGEEARYLLAAVDNPGHSVKAKSGDRRNEWMPSIVRWAIETAMRQSEILALDWRHVDLEKRTAHLPETKNGTARTVPLSTTAVALIQPGGNVLRMRRGKVVPTTASALKQSFTRAVARGRRDYEKDCAARGESPAPGFLEDLHFHDLRHEATSRLAERLQLHELMRVTGHKDTRMLARYYHPRPEDLAKKLG
jgi:integrase